MFLLLRILEDMREAQIISFFGTAIRRLRAEFDFSQDTLAERAGLSKNFIARVERGEQQPSLVSIYRIADAFDRSGSQLLAELEELSERRKRVAKK